MIGAMAHELNQKFKNLTFSACFSRSKEEIYFEFTNGKEAWGWSILFHSRGLFFRNGLVKYKNGKDLKQYKEEMGQSVVAIIPVSGERCFVLKLSNGHELIFKCYGIHANIIRQVNGETTDIYRTHLTGDINFQIPTPQMAPAENYKTRGGYRIMKVPEGWTIWKDDVPIDQGESVLEGLSLFTGIYLKASAIEDERQKQLKHLHSEIRKEEKKRHEVNQRIHELNTEESLEQRAHLIMAHLHELKSGDEKTFPDLYSDQTIYIKIPGQKTPQQYAADLYRKQKNRKIELQFLEGKSASLAHRIEHYKSKIQRLESGEVTPTIQPKKQDAQTEKFKRYSKDGWDIYAGKSATNNEILTFEFAGKNDIWLHAADVTGSHVIIRNPSGTLVPEQVMMFAASIALALSRNKHTSLGRVVYSQRKHISRVRKGNIGEVHIMKPQYIDAAPIEDIK